MWFKLKNKVELNSNNLNHNRFVNEKTFKVFQRGENSNNLYDFNFLKLENEFKTLKNNNTNKLNFVVTNENFNDIIILVIYMLFL